MGASRNGTQNRPETGERGIASASDVYSLFRYGDRRPPTVRELSEMVGFDPWSEAIVGALTWPIRAAKWSIEEAEGDRGEADFVRERWKPLAARAVAGALGAVGHRISFAEQVWEYDGEDVVLTDLAFRDPEQCTVLRDGNLRPVGFRQRAYAPGEPGNPGPGSVDQRFFFRNRKAYLFFHDGVARPGRGKSALESAYQHYVDKGKLTFLSNKSLELYGAPSTHGKTDAPEGSDERDSFEGAVKDARAGAAIVTDHEKEIGYLDPPNAGEAFERRIRSLNFESAVSDFVQFLALAQEGNSGAYALSRDHSDFLTIVTDGRMVELADSLSAGPIHDMVFWNFGPDAAFPTKKFEPISDADERLIREASDRLFAKAGRPMPKWVAERLVERWAASMGIEKPEDADEIGEPVKDRTSDTEGTDER